VGAVGLAQEPIVHGICELVLVLVLVVLVLLVLLVLVVLLLVVVHCSSRLFRLVADRDRHWRHPVRTSLHLDYPRREMRPPYILPRRAMTVHKPPHRRPALAI
jgi:hypothetical protein